MTEALGVKGVRSGKERREEGGEREQCMLRYCMHVSCLLFSFVPQHFPPMRFFPGFQPFVHMHACV